MISYITSFPSFLFLCFREKSWQDNWTSEARRSWAGGDKNTCRNTISIWHYAWRCRKILWSICQGNNNIRVGDQYCEFHANFELKSTVFLQLILNCQCMVCANWSQICIKEVSNCFWQGIKVIVKMLLINLRHYASFKDKPWHCIPLPNFWLLYIYVNI